MLGYQMNDNKEREWKKNTTKKKRNIEKQLIKLELKQKVKLQPWKNKINNKYFKKLIKDSKQKVK